MDRRVSVVWTVKVYVNYVIPITWYFGYEWQQDRFIHLLKLFGLNYTYYGGMFRVREEGELDMTRQEAHKIGREMREAGYTVGYRHYPDESYVDAYLPGQPEVTISNPEQWAQLRNKQGAPR